MKIIICINRIILFILIKVSEKFDEMKNELLQTFKTGFHSKHIAIINLNDFYCKSCSWQKNLLLTECNSYLFSEKFLILKHGLFEFFKHPGGALFIYNLFTSLPNYLCCHGLRKMFIISCWMLPLNDRTISTQTSVWKSSLIPLTTDSPLFQHFKSPSLKWRLQTQYRDICFSGCEL